MKEAKEAKTEPLTPVCERAVFPFLHFLYFLNVLNSVSASKASRHAARWCACCPRSHILLRADSFRSDREANGNAKGARRILPRCRTIFPEFGCSIRLNPRQVSPA